MANTNSQRCAECGAMNPNDARACMICGNRLVRGKSRHRQSVAPVPTMRGDYRPEAGEDDLLVRSAVNTPLGVVVGVLILLLIVGVGLVAGLEILARAGEDDTTTQMQDNVMPQGTAESATPVTPSITPLPSNTRPAPRAFPTVTPLPPTATVTPTEGPCTQRAVAGDTIYGLAQRCGHRNFSIVDVIVEANPELACATCLQEGQEIVIPWPTPTVGATVGEDENTSFNPNAGISADSNTAVDVAEGESVAAEPQSASVNEFGTPDALATLFVEPTLRPGLQWHTIQENENMIIIAQRYDADAKVLSDINPEIDFAQCDFSERYGGPNCSVLLVPGQRLRVPAPPPTATLSLTPSGSLTPTPSATPTFNAPIALAPQDDAEFGRNSLVTLRWSALGSLAANEVYLVTVRELPEEDDGEAVLHRGQTAELFFVVPDGWQSEVNAFAEYEWTVSIATLDDSGVVDAVREETRPRRFVWQGR